MVELLSPARDLTCLITAINNGADSVYCGLKDLNMRFTAKNFNKEELKEGIKYAHDRDKKVYLCINTVVYEKDIEKLKDVYDYANSVEVDGVIVSDIGAMIMAKEYGLNIHCSVQTNITNSKTVEFYSKFAKRVILSRELTLNQIKEIKNNLKNNNINLELEGFIHGSLCVAISGRCFLSSYLFNKNANCGDCLQPCRRKWKLINEHDDGTYELVCKGKYLLSPKDLCMIEHIPDLIGVLDSFKIEGRAKGPDYVKTVVKVYREAIDSYFDGTYYDKIDYFKRELKKVYNRDYDTGFYFRDVKNNSDIQYNFEGNISPYRKIEVGQVLNYYKKVNVAEVKLFKDVKVGDEILIIGNKTGCVEDKIQSMEINHKKVSIGKKGDRVGIKLNNIVREGDMVYKIYKVDNI